MVKVCTTPGLMVPLLGSTVNGGSSGEVMRKDITLARALEGRTAGPSDLLPGGERELPAVTNRTL